MLAPPSRGRWPSGKRWRLLSLYRRALRRMPATIDGVPPLAVPTECPVTLEELLAEPTK